jgi:mRNA interferase RelE/StbE
VSYEVEYTTSAFRQLQKLDRTVQARIVSGIDELPENPRPAGVEKLSGADGWRIRIGNYRVVYMIDDGQQIVTVTRVGHRREVYRRN